MKYSNIVYVNSRLLSLLGLKSIILGLSFVLLCFALQAQLGGHTVFNSFNIPSSARVAAMGGSYFAVKDSDVHLAQFNPSLLDSAMSEKLGISYVDYFDGINMGYASYARNINSKLTAGATMQFNSYGKQTEYDPLGYEIGDFYAADYALILGAGYQYDSLWSLGANFKTIYSTLANYASLAVAVDAAATYHNKEKKFTASLIMRNLGLQIKTYTADTREKLPLEFQFGITKQPAHAPFRLSLVYDNMQQWNLSYINPNEVLITDPVTGQPIEDKQWVFGDRLMRHLVFGTEFLLSENIHIRAGYNYRRRQELKISDRPGTAGLSFGLGIKVSRFHISYARATYHFAGPSNTFSVTTNMSQW